MVYQVPQNPAYTQQRNIFRLEDGTNPNSRKILIHNLKELVMELREKGHDVIISMGNFNEQVGINPHGRASVLTAGGPIHSQVTRHSIENYPPTYA
jgi:hypothetical protein